MFQKATKSKARLRMALVGPAGSGKTYTALRIASAMCKRIAVIDTERGSASKYAHKFDFDVVELSDYDPSNFVKAIRAAASVGYDGLVVDSLSHAWSGTGGALELVDRATSASRTKNTFTDGWRDVTPRHNEMVDTILTAPMHVFVTMRVKTEYVMEENERGKKVPRKVGLAPVQRAGVDYEFDVVCDIDTDHRLVVSKTRCEDVDGYTAKPAGEDLAKKLETWLTDGVDAPTPALKTGPEPPPKPDQAALFAGIRARLAACADTKQLSDLVGDIKALPEGAAKEDLRRAYGEKKAALA